LATRFEAVSRSPFGSLPDGTAVDLFTLKNARGVVLGFERLEDYLTKSRYFGAVVGRYGNRIANGRFTLDGRTFQLATNNGPNHLHGGIRGFDKVVWKGEPFERGGDAGVVFTYRSADGEEGYPGTLSARVTYTLSSRSELIVEYEATTDKATPVNLTQHMYFNLAGAGDILQHQLTLEADRYVPVDDTLIPVGELTPVEGTPFDFRRPAAIGARIDGDHEQLRRAKGYDHTFVLSPVFTGPTLHHAARVVEPSTGRTLDVVTTQPGVQFYSGNSLDAAANGFARRAGFCLETQHFPDSPNQPAFPSTILRPGGRYASKTVFTFGVTRS
jgi:aldose 1-epimerase